MRVVEYGLARSLSGFCLKCSSALCLSTTDLLWHFAARPVTACERQQNGTAIVVWKGQSLRAPTAARDDFHLLRCVDRRLCSFQCGIRCFSEVWHRGGRLPRQPFTGLRPCTSNNDIVFFSIGDPTTNQTHPNSTLNFSQVST